MIGQLPSDVHERLAAVAAHCRTVHASATGGVLLRVYADSHVLVGKAFADDIDAALQALSPGVQPDDGPWCESCGLPETDDDPMIEHYGSIGEHFHVRCHAGCQSLACQRQMFGED